MKKYINTKLNAGQYKRNAKRLKPAIKKLNNFGLFKAGAKINPKKFIKLFAK